MPWGDAGVSKRLTLSSGAQAWGQPGVPITYNIPQTGIVRRLRVHHEATPTFTPGTGSVALDVQGPWNAYQRFQLLPNSISPIVDVSGFGLALINQLIARERQGASLDVSIATVTNAEPGADTYNGSATTGSTSLRWAMDLPIAQVVRSLGGEVGYFPTQNPAVQLALNVTPNSAATLSSGNYTYGSATATTLPYLLGGVATATVATPSFDVIRDLWEMPANAADAPSFGWVSQWLEGAPQGSVVGSTQVPYSFAALSGILVRAIGYIYDGNTSKGIAPNTLTAANAFTLLYGSGTAKSAETGTQALMRQRDELGFDMTQGAYFLDFMGPNLTLQDAMNTYEVGNISLQFNITAALAAGSTARVLRQMLQPINPIAG